MDSPDNELTIDVELEEDNPRHQVAGLCWAAMAEIRSIIENSSEDDDLTFDHWSLDKLDSIASGYLPDGEIVPHPREACPVVNLAAWRAKRQ